MIYENYCSLVGITCVVCRGILGSSCLNDPGSQTINLECDKCAVFVRLYKIGKFHANLVSHYQIIAELNLIWC